MEENKNIELHDVDKVRLALIKDEDYLSDNLNIVQAKCFTDPTPGIESMITWMYFNHNLIYRIKDTYEWFKEYKLFPDVGVAERLSLIRDGTDVHFRSLVRILHEGIYYLVPFQKSFHWDCQLANRSKETEKLFRMAYTDMFNIYRFYNPRGWIHLRRVSHDHLTSIPDPVQLSDRKFHDPIRAEFTNHPHFMEYLEKVKQKSKL